MQNPAILFIRDILMDTRQGIKPDWNTKWMGMAETRAILLIENHTELFANMLREMQLIKHHMKSSAVCRKAPQITNTEYFLSPPGNVCCY